jgi:hypothetical protein
MSLLSFNRAIFYSRACTLPMCAAVGCVVKKGEFVLTSGYGCLIRCPGGAAGLLPAPLLAADGEQELQCDPASWERNWSAQVLLLPPIPSPLLKVFIAGLQRVGAACQSTAPIAGCPDRP